MKLSCKETAHSELLDTEFPFLWNKSGRSNEYSMIIERARKCDHGWLAFFVSHRNFKQLNVNTF